MIVTPIIPTLASSTRNNPDIMGVKFSTSVTSFFWDFQTDLGRHISWNIYHGISIKALNREVGDANGDAAQNDHAQQLLRKQKPCCFTATSQQGPNKTLTWQYMTRSEEYDMTTLSKYLSKYDTDSVSTCIYHYISLYITIYHYISLYIIIYHYISLYIYIIYTHYIYTLYYI